MFQKIDAMKRSKQKSCPNLLLCYWVIKSAKPKLAILIRLVSRNYIIIKCNDDIFLYENDCIHTSTQRSMITQ